MEIIQLKDINIDELSLLKYQGTKSLIYNAGDDCIKIFKDLYPYELDNMYHKLLEMDGLEIDGVILPKSIILDGDTLVGFVMDNFKNSYDIMTYLTSSRYINISEILLVMKRASKILKRIHENNIICQDLSFDNILINQSGEVRYVDIDGATFEGYSSPYISKLLKRFMDYRKDRLCLVSKNMDRVSFFLSFMLIVYLKELQKVSKSKYHAISDNVVTLENCRDYANMILCNRTITEIPYLDELIDDTDSFVIDRYKQINLVQKLLYRGK